MALLYEHQMKQLVLIFSHLNQMSSYSTLSTLLKKNLEMYQYDVDAPAQGHPQPHAGILQKMKLKKGP